MSKPFLCTRCWRSQGHEIYEMDEWETYSPVVSAVRLVLIMSMVFGMTTWCMDSMNTFVHPKLPKEDYYFFEIPKQK